MQGRFQKEEDAGMKKGICASMCLVLAAALLLTGCQGGGLEKVRLAEVTHSVFYAAQYVAMERGFFADEGLEIELTNAGGADKAMTALLAGQADIALMGPESAVYVANEGRKDAAAVVGQLTQCDGAFILGREKEENFTLESLRGKSILGGRAGGIPLMTLEYALRKAGLEPGKDVEVRSDIQFNAMAGAFAGGEGDYTTLFEPTATAMESEGQSYVLASVGEMAGEVPYTCYQVTRSALEKKSDTVLRFLRAIARAQRFVQENDAKTVAEALAPAFADTPVETLETVVERYRSIGAFAQTPVMHEEAYERLLDIMEQAGELESRPAFETIVDNSLAERAQKG